ncbi:MAG: response regulator [Anaerolineae bacterium]|nr:response regulator [Anaerolineae bacterium]
MKTILVIDDDLVIRQLVTAVFKSENYCVLAAPNGSIGLELAQQHLPDLVICDINMPDMDGYAVLAALQANEATADIPFIFLSAREERDDIRRGMNLGADDYVTKPFRVGELASTVATRLEKQANLARQSEKKLDDLRTTIAQALPRDLQAPISVVRQNSHRLVEDLRRTNAEYAAMFEAVDHSAERLYRLADRFWTFVDTEQGRISPNQTSQTRQTSDVITGVAKDAARADHREDDLVLSLVDVPVSMPEDYLRKIVHELATNAFKFSKSGTPVEITTCLREDRLIMKVSDQGRGMTREQIASISPYMQFDRHRYEQQGMGLGLIIVKRLSEIYGGQMSIESIVGQGTSVSIVLPYSTTR